MIYSIILVNYHSIQEIVACLSSFNAVHTAHDVEIVIVSNSVVTDSEKDTVNTVSPDCKWIQLENNIGYGQACNVGAIESRGDYIFFLNPDTRFINDALPILKRQVDNKNQKAAVGPATYNSNLSRISSVKNKVTFMWMIQWLFPPFGNISPKSGSLDPSLYESVTEVDIVNGSAIFMHKNAFNETGGFSDEYFMYWEENDFCLSLKKHGYMILYAPEAKIVHDSGHSTKRIFLPMEIQKHRSQKTFLKKHHPQLARFNRLIGVFAYSWRYIGSLLLFRKEKMKQFRTLFIWYLLQYE